MLRDSDSWQARLPFEMLERVVWPLRVDFFHDESVPASKWRGYDFAGALCYYRHWFALWDDCPDDEEPYRRLIVTESLEAWRTFEGTWIRQILRSEGSEPCHGRGFDSGFETVAAHAIPRL
jgi:hypothetical protein